MKTPPDQADPGLQPPGARSTEPQETGARRFDDEAARMVAAVWATDRDHGDEQRTAPGPESITGQETQDLPPSPATEGGSQESTPDPAASAGGATDFAADVAGHSDSKTAAPGVAATTAARIRKRTR